MNIIKLFILILIISSCSKQNIARITAKEYGYYFDMSIGKVKSIYYINNKEYEIVFDGKWYNNHERIITNVEKPFYTLESNYINDFTNNYKKYVSRWLRILQDGSTTPLTKITMYLDYMRSFDEVVGKTILFVDNNLCAYNKKGNGTYIYLDTKIYTFPDMYEIGERYLDY